MWQWNFMEGSKSMVRLAYHTMWICFSIPGGAAYEEYVLWMLWLYLTTKYTFLLIDGMLYTAIVRGVVNENKWNVYLAVIS